MRIITSADGEKIKVYENGEFCPELTAEDCDMDRRIRAAVKATLYHAKVCKKPIAKYDLETKQAYLEYSDGRRKYFPEKKEA